MENEDLSEDQGFVWYLCRSVIITKDNFTKRDLHGSTKNVLCHNDETLNTYFSNANFLDLYE
jgi:hypothetical protein